jgi:hypothetical protein
VHKLTGRVEMGRKEEVSALENTVKYCCSEFLTFYKNVYIKNVLKQNMMCKIHCSMKFLILISCHSCKGMPVFFFHVSLSVYSGIM